MVIHYHRPTFGAGLLRVLEDGGRLVAGVVRRVLAVDREGEPCVVTDLVCDDDDDDDDSICTFF